MPRAFVTRLITGGITAYQKLVARLERKWENKHPQSFQNYALFKNGMHSTLIDLNDLRRVWTRIAMDNRSIVQLLPSMTHRELFVFRQVPKDVIRATPLLILAPLPGTFLLYPLFFAYPRFFLTRQFWTDEQRTQFSQTNLDRCMTLPPDLLLTDLQQTAQRIRQDRRTSALMLQHLSLFDTVYQQVTSGIKPSIEHLTQLIPLFQGPFALKHLSRSHLVNLCKLHDLTLRSTARHTPFPLVSGLMELIEPSALQSRRLGRLRARSHLLAAEDRLLQRDFNAPESTESAQFRLDRDECVAICLLRGIDPFRQELDSVLRDLRSWITTSLAASESNHSYRLHLPILLFHRTFQTTP